MSNLQYRLEVEVFKNEDKVAIDIFHYNPDNNNIILAEELVWSEGLPPDIN